MAYLERQRRKNKEYFYVTRSFRLGSNRWGKIRRYCGNKEPTEEEVERMLGEIESEACRRGWARKDKNCRFLEEDRAKALEEAKKGCCHKDLAFLTRFAHNTNAIGGSRLMFHETEAILSENIIHAGVSVKDYNETINVRDCLEYVGAYRGNLGKRFILNVHRELLKNTGHRKVGGYRNGEARITGSDWTPPRPDEIEEEMTKLLSWWRNNEKRMHPVELAGLLHNKLSRIHPFADGNGRCARMLMNWALLRGGYPACCIENSEKLEYFWAIEIGDRGDDSKFIKYLADTLIKDCRNEDQGFSTPSLE